MARALVTGITGQDGSYLAELLVGRGDEVWGLVRSADEADPRNLDRVRDSLRFVEGDLLEPESLRAAVREVRPEELYHLAAPTFVPDSWDDPSETVEAIATATGALLGAAVALEERPRVWVATSSEIFGDAGESPQNERSPMRPQTPYGVAKLAAHGLVGAMRAQHGLFACSGITYNHESPRRPERFLPRKVTRAAAAIALGLEDELVLGDLDAVRDWCDARDVARAAVMALGHREPGDYVVASGIGRTVRQLVEVAFGHAQVAVSGHVRTDAALVRPRDATPPVGDPSKARQTLGWAPEISFQAMIAEMVDADTAALRIAAD